ncbi:uncharacterized protein BDZ99DRAFT_517280 [Mytilinidion resinicola]|uniref:Uncharacterized protein n=1 Tax=Mytilinidion resinicola TaxID=574789 RepID=A0A6A6YWU1_9PEZI|nr:uncharacterized protein BDZ99DRAFT_517280 [Mytilinidion resinicola]KAF2812989.1 hypothetical protein BDZ99DRAFT_517280 [Mytilinidion resinicola]
MRVVSSKQQHEARRSKHGTAPCAIEPTAAVRAHSSTGRAAREQQARAGGRTAPGSAATVATAERRRRAMRAAGGGGCEAGWMAESSREAGGEKRCGRGALTRMTKQSRNASETYEHPGISGKNNSGNAREDTRESRNGKDAVG